MTMMVPKASERGMVRRGSFTSPAVNVMLFHASAEKSDPVCATQSATNMPEAVTTDTPSAIDSTPRGSQNAPKLAATASPFHPRSRPTAMSATTAPVLAVVKVFCTNLP
ncbi:MAG: hypothetical protein A3H29_03705 [Acidobacteria bacterium RIFCSPLOWO2_02_FULL_67_21]|nr:MAG: hypothetical protein A3H29_03705 [Acidobacteria bacterium RIFCSPLOWO2_02_FULL_67_21]